MDSMAANDLQSLQAMKKEQRNSQKDTCVAGDETRDFFEFFYHLFSVTGEKTLEWSRRYSNTVFIIQIHI